MNEKTVTGFTGEAMALLRAYAWPGNVRELRNVIEPAVIPTRSSEVDSHALPSSLRVRNLESSGPLPPRTERSRELHSPEGTTLEETARWLVLRTLEATDYNKTQAAGMLGVSAKTVYNKLRTWTASGHEDARAAEVRCRARWWRNEPPMPRESCLGASA